jgi:hypothetical protein
MRTAAELQESIDELRVIIDAILDAGGTDGDDLIAAAELLVAAKRQLSSLNRVTPPFDQALWESA